MKHQIVRRDNVIVLVALAALSTQAFAATPPWTVYRAPQSGGTESMSMLAVATESPWDDAPGMLSDGVSYFYMITDGTGATLPISADKNLFLDTVRLGFEDGIPTNGAVDALTSTVVVNPKRVPADGISTSRVTIVPRDQNGVSLGPGLVLSLDAAALWPGTLVGSIVDAGNGSYVARVASVFEGFSIARPTAQGVVFDSQATIEFYFALPMSLRDQAVRLLGQLTAPGGAFDQLVNGLDPGSDPGASRIGSGKSDALAALSLLLSGDPQADDEAIKDILKQAVVDLNAALADPGDVDPAAIEALIRELLDLSRLLAEYWYDAGASACGTSHAGWSRLDQAEAFLINGDASYASEDWVGAVTQYGKSIEKSLQALTICG